MRQRGALPVAVYHQRTEYVSLPYTCVSLKYNAVKGFSELSLFIAVNSGALPFISALTFVNLVRHELCIIQSK